MYLNWKDMELNNDWVLRDLYAYDKIDICDIATYKIITYAKSNVQYLFICLIYIQFLPGTIQHT